MRQSLKMMAIFAGLVATDASAQVQGVSLNGKYRCEAYCGGRGRLAFITQNGWDFNVVTNSGQASRGWVDWPGHVWIEGLQQGAIYSPDGKRIQLDNGTILRRF